MSAPDMSTSQKVVLIAIAGVSALAFGIAAVIIGAQNLGAPCAMRASPPLDVWLIVYGAMALAGFALTIPLVWWLDKLYLGFMLYTFVWGCFMFAWMIVGSVALFRDAPQCLDLNYPLWAMSLAVLVLMYVTAFFNCCVGYRFKRN